MSHIPEIDLILYALDPGSLSPEQRAALASHLSGCSLCQEAYDHLRESEGVLEQELRDPSTWEPVSGSETRSALAALDALRAQEDDAAAMLLAPYLANPADAAWTSSLSTARFRTGGVVRALIRAAHDVSGDNPLAALTFANNAIAIAKGLDDSRYSRSAIDQWCGTAYKELAAAQILLGRLPEAHISLDASERYHRRYTPNGLGLSTVAFARGVLLYEQNKYDEALALADQAAKGFAHIGEERRRMEAMFMRAVILREVGHAKEAIALFQSFLDYSEDSGRLDLIGRAESELGNCFVSLRDVNEASRRFSRALAIFRESGRTDQRLVVEWGIAEITMAVGRHGDALQPLRAIAAEFEERGQVTFAALVDLDLMECLIALGMRRFIAPLAKHRFDSFMRAGMLTGALSALSYLRDSSESVTVDVLKEVRRFLRRAERQPHLAFDPPPPQGSPKNSV